MTARAGDDNYPQAPLSGQRRTGWGGTEDNSMDIADWRKRIDEIDVQLVAMINERAKAASAIGALKRQMALPIYEPQREQMVFDNVRRANQGPLADGDLLRIFERIMDVMRKLQRDQGVAQARSAAGSGSTEFEAEVNE